MFLVRFYVKKFTAWHLLRALGAVRATSTVAGGDLSDEPEVKRNPEAAVPLVGTDMHQEEEIVGEEEKIDRIIKEPLMRGINPMDMDRVKQVVEERINEVFPVREEKKMEIEEKILQKIQEEMVPEQS